MARRQARGVVVGHRPFAYSVPTLPYSSHEKSTHVAEEARGACDDNEESLQSSLILGVLRRVGWYRPVWALTL